METTIQTFNERGRNHQQFLLAADHIRRNAGTIKASWEDKVRQQVADSNKQSSKSLVNSLAIFLEDLAGFVSQGHYTDDTLHGKGMSKEHGSFRASFSGYFLPQLLKEFSILRKVIADSLQSEGQLTYEVRAVIEKTIDDAISLAATEFVLVQGTQTKAALEMAEKSNHSLEHFAAIAAHDLKSPLATITGYLSLLKDKYDDKKDDEDLEFINLSLGASERMRSLVDSLLSFASLSTNKKELEPVDLNLIVESAKKNLADTIKKNEARIQVDALPRVMGDRDLLTELFQNLIANAIKFKAKDAPEIQITRSQSNGFYTFSIKDNGIGFDPKLKTEIFELYKKLSGQYAGSGIGLATCKRILELHGGEIWAESTPGKGSVFYFTLKPSGQSK